MKKVHLYVCFGLWVLWIRGMWLIGILTLVTLFDVFFNTFYHISLFWAIVEPYTSFVLLSMLPIEPVLFIIALIIETLEWTKKSFLTVVLPFLITVILWHVYIGVFIMGTGGV